MSFALRITLVTLLTALVVVPGAGVAEAGKARVAQECADLGLRLVSPVDPERCGSQVCYAHPHGYAIIRALIERGVIGDFRAPDVVRFGFAPLYTRHVDVLDAVLALREVLATRAYEAPRFQARALVT